MSTPLGESSLPPRFEFGLGTRLATIAGVLLAEAILHTLLRQWSIPLFHDTADAEPFYLAHDLFKFAIAYAAFSLLLIAIQRRDDAPLIGTQGGRWPVRLELICLHGALILALGARSLLWPTVSRDLASDALTIAWLVAGAGAVLALFGALAPLTVCSLRSLPPLRRSSP
jgi:hypothetical protein